MSKKKSDDLPIRAAKLRSLACQPYLASAIWRLRYFESNRIPTMGVTKNWDCGYNKEWIATLDVLELATVIVHEVWHLLRGHTEQAINARITTDTMLRWNVAADCEINDDLGPPLQLPKGTLLPSKFGLEDGHTVEYYYDNLPKEPSGQGNEGSGVTGVGADWEDGAPDGGSPLSELEKKLIRKQVAEAIRGTAPGNLPEGAKLWAEEYLTPRVNWRAQLSGACKQAIAYMSGQVDYTFLRPSRRQGIFPDVGMPSLRAPIPRVAIVLDTSGSMSCEKRLEKAVAEVSGIIQSTRVPAEVFCTDAEAYESRSVFNVKQMELIGGGGTDMGVGLQAAADKKHNTVIVITDGETPWPATRPKGVKDVIVCLVAGDREGVPTWAKKIVVTDT